MPLSDERGGWGGGGIDKLFLLSVFVFETFIPQIVNLPVIQIIAMIKRICLLPTWADRFYCRSSVSGMCKRISTSALIRRSKNIMVLNDVEVSKGNCKLPYLCLFYTVHHGFDRQ